MKNKEINEEVVEEITKGLNVISKDRGNEVCIEIEHSFGVYDTAVCRWINEDQAIALISFLEEQFNL